MAIFMMADIVFLDWLDRVIRLNDWSVSAWRKECAITERRYKGNYKEKSGLEELVSWLEFRVLCDEEERRMK